MALIPCGECKKTVSSKASKCPHCGAAIEGGELTPEASPQAQPAPEFSSGRTAPGGFQAPTPVKTVTANFQAPREAFHEPTPTGVLMKQALEALSGKWGPAIGTVLIFSTITFIIQVVPVIGQFASLIVSGPMTVGLATYILHLSRDEEAIFAQIFSGFDKFGAAASAFVLVSFFTFLWTLLFIIPGLIAALSYSMTFFIIADEDSIKANEAVERSKAIMNGNKMRLFGIFARLFGLGILCILTLGIGFLWLGPYGNVLLAKFYDDIKGQAA